MAKPLPDWLLPQSDDDVLQTAMTLPAKSGMREGLTRGAVAGAAKWAPQLAPMVGAARTLATKGSGIMTVAQLLKPRTAEDATMTGEQQAAYDKKREGAEWLSQQPGYEKPGEPPASFYRESSQRGQKE